MHNTNQPTNQLLRLRINAQLGAVRTWSTVFGGFCHSGGCCCRLDLM